MPPAFPGLKTLARPLLLATLLIACCLHARTGEGGIGDFLGEGVDFKGGMLDWEEDDNGRRIAILRNYAVVILPQVTISARNMVLNIELQEIYAEGNVLFDEAAGNAFYCDQLTFNYQEWHGLAKNIRIKVERADVELPVRDFLDSQPSTAMRASTRSLSDPAPGASDLKRLYVQADELRAHDADTFELINAKITPSAFARPHWHFNSPAALYRKREKIESYHNTVKIGKVPVLYFPYLIRDLQYDWPWMRITGGHTSDFGYFVRTQWGWRLNPRDDQFIRAEKLFFDVDFFSRRGVGLGIETTYKAGDLDSLGKLKLYGVYEYAISRDRDRRRALESNHTKIYQNNPGFTPSLYRNDFRWAVEWEHYQQLNELWDVRAEANLYHDRDYLREYDEARFWNAKEPENSIDVRRLDKHWMLEFVASSRLSNKWRTQSEYYPEMRLTVPGYQLGDMPLYFKNDMRVGVVNRRFDEDRYRFDNDGLFALDDLGLAHSRLVNGDNFGTMFRAFNEMRVEAPLKLGNALTVKPWVGLRTAYYSDTIGEPYPASHWDGMTSGFDWEARNRGVFTPGQLQRKGSGEFDFAVPFGVDVSTRTYTLFGADEQWRLITEPVLSYLENPKSRLEYSDNLYPIDYYDVYQRQRRLGFELHNKLQRRYFEDAPGSTVPERDILDFNVAFYHYPRKSDRERVNNGNRYSEVSADLIFRPIPNLTLKASADWSVEDSTFNRAILSADWRLNDMFRVFVTHYHYRGDFAPFFGVDPSSQTHFAIRTKLWNDSSRYSLEGAVAYEWRDTTASDAGGKPWLTDQNAVRHGFNKYRITLFRDMDTFELALSYVRNRNDDDHGVFFSLSPKSFMGYDRPPPSFSVDVEALADGRYPNSIRYLGDGYLIDGPIADADLKDVQF